MAIIFLLTKNIHIVELLKKCECGISNEFPSTTRIIGGVNYNPNKYPWLVILQLNGSFLCGGSVISDKYILSAAHCLKDRFDQNLIKVVVGEHSRCKSDSNSNIFSVRQIIKHKKFNSQDYSANIMLVKLSMTLSFNKFVKPVCLPIFDIRQDTVSKYSGKIAKVVGWGKRYPQSSNPSCLPQELEIPILERRHCSSPKPTLFCAGYIEGGKDSCQGDSGGPLQILNRKNKFEIIGVVSNGIGCAMVNHPGLYTDVTRYLPWIWKQTRGSMSCF